MLEHNKMASIINCDIIYKLSESLGKSQNNMVLYPVSTIKNNEDIK